MGGLWLTIGLAWAAGGAVERAAPTVLEPGAQVRLDPFVLAKEDAIALSAEGATKISVTVDGSVCAAQPRAEAGTFDLVAGGGTPCARLWSPDASGVLTVTLATKKTYSVPVAVEAPATRAETSVEHGDWPTVPTHVDKVVGGRAGASAWTSQRVQQGVVDGLGGLGDWVAADAPEGVYVVRYATSGGVVEHRFTRAPRILTAPDGWCPDPARREDVHVCFDSSGGGLSSHVRRAAEAEKLPETLLPPNSTVRVYAWHPAGLNPRLTTTGAVGYTAGALLEQLSVQSGVPDGDPSAGVGTEGAEPTWTEWVLAPRAPGQALELTLSMPTEVGTSARVELVTDVRYIGAVRIGIGAGWVPGAAAYGERDGVLVEQSPGGFQPDTRIVVGYAPFFDPGGRSYTLGASEGLSLKPAPYVGLGVLDPASVVSSSALAFLDAVYVGAEVELATQFSVALAGALQAGEGLQPGVVLGREVNDETELTQRVYRPGVALVVNLSPEFFRRVKKASGGDFTGTT